MLDKEKNIKDLEFVEGVLREIKGRNTASHQLSLGIMVGLVLGIIGNLWVSLLLNYIVPKWFLEVWALCIFTILNIIICFFIIMYLLDDRKFKRGFKSIENEIEKVLNLKEDIEEERIVISNYDLKMKFIRGKYD